MMENVNYISLWERAIPYRHLSVVYTLEEIEDYDKIAVYGLESCGIFIEKKI